jgi:hypothetical protein
LPLCVSNGPKNGFGRKVEGGRQGVDKPLRFSEVPREKFFELPKLLRNLLITHPPNEVGLA